MNDGTVIEKPAGHYVTAGDGIIAGPFKTNAEAWSWIDQHSDEGRDASDRYNRIRIAFGQMNNADRNVTPRPLIKEGGTLRPHMQALK